MALAITAPAETAHQALRPGAAAVVGGWSGVYRAIQGVVLQPVIEEGGCLKLAGRGVAIDDHQTVDSLSIDRPHEIQPGRYAVVGVHWQEDWGEDTLYGLSRPEGELWTVVIAPNAVTDIGVWPVTSPYPHRYVLGNPEPKAAQAAAAANGVGPLVMAAWVKAPVLAADGSCTAPAK